MNINFCSLYIYIYLAVLLCLKNLICWKNKDRKSDACGHSAHYHYTALWDMFNQFYHFTQKNLGVQKLNKQISLEYVRKLEYHMYYQDLLNYSKT